MNNGKRRPDSTLKFHLLEDFRYPILFPLLHNSRNHVRLHAGGSGMSSSLLSGKAIIIIIIIIIMKHLRTLSATSYIASYYKITSD